MPQHTLDNKSTMVQFMAWCHQATSHYQSQSCWLRSMSPYDVTRPQWLTVHKYGCQSNINYFGASEILIISFMTHIQIHKNSSEILQLISTLSLTSNSNMIPTNLIYSQDNEWILKTWVRHDWCYNMKTKSSMGSLTTMDLLGFTKTKSPYMPMSSCPSYIS